MTAPKPRRPRQTYSADFKADAVLIPTTSSSIVAQTTRDPGTGDTPLRNWVKVSPALENVLSTDERAELLPFRRENRRLKEERENLEKAAALFTKEQRQWLGTVLF